MLKVLSEGVDVPALDGIAFINQKEVKLILSKQLEDR